MSGNLTRLELTWPGKENKANPEPRILIEDVTKSYSQPVSDTKEELFEDEKAVQPTFDNLLIHGDNLLALKSLEQDYTGKVKCIYIDPPYNTGNAFEHYDDGVEHSIWLSLMRDRLEILKRLLSDDGVIFVQIDDSESSYLKVLMDEIFDRNNYEVTFYVQVRYAGKTLAEKNSYQKLIEHIHCYRKTSKYLPQKEKAEYSLDSFCWDISTKEPCKILELKGRKVEVFTEENYTISQVPPSSDKLKETWASGTILKNNASGKFFADYLAPRVKDDGLKILYKVYGIGEDGLGYRFFTGPKKEGATKGKFYSGVPLTKLEQMKTGKALKEKSIENFWDFAASFGNCRLEGNAEFRSGKKPEALIQRILEMSTTPGDLVLDSFLGSGTTAAVAHKMGRRWIGVEMGDHVYTHCLPRLQKVINGEDQGGITKSTNWKGGGGFKFYELASSLITKDKMGKEIIDPKYNADMLAEAMCKLMGYHYHPDTELYWKQGYASEKSFIFTTTNNLQPEDLKEIQEKLGEANLLICCGAFRGDFKAFPNMTLKKIPAAVLKKCEWGKPGYPLPVREDFTDADFEFEEEE